MTTGITPPGLLANFANDRVGSYDFPKQKLVFGVDGTATDVSATNALPVTFVNTSLAITAASALAVTGTFFQATQPVSGNVGLTGTLPAFAATPTVTVGNASLVVTGTFFPPIQPVSIAVPVALSAGTAAIGAVTVTPPASGVLAGVNGGAALASLAATTGTATITTVTSGAYKFRAVFTGTSLQLRELGPDGVSYFVIGTLTASGIIGVVVGNGATLQLFNPNGAAVTSIWSDLI